MDKFELANRLGDIADSLHNLRREVRERLNEDSEEFDENLVVGLAFECGRLEQLAKDVMR